MSQDAVRNRARAYAASDRVSASECGEAARAVSFYAGVKMAAGEYAEELELTKLSQRLNRLAFATSREVSQ